MAQRIKYENSSDIGVFVKLTNTYCIAAHGTSQNFRDTLFSEIGTRVPVVQTSIADTNAIGRMCVGNRHGLVVPRYTTDRELRTLRNMLPDDVIVRRVEEKLTALGNIIACNDYFAIAHPSLDRKSEEIISDALGGIEVFRMIIGDRSLVGSHCAVNNKGCLVHARTQRCEIEELAKLLQVPIISGTVNHGCEAIGSGLVVNDWYGFVGYNTTNVELLAIDGIFKIRDDDRLQAARQSLIDSMC